MLKKRIEQFKIVTFSSGQKIRVLTKIMTEGVCLRKYLMHTVLNDCKPCSTAKILMITKSLHNNRVIGIGQFLLFDNGISLHLSQ